MTLAGLQPVRCGFHNGTMMVRCSILPVRIGVTLIQGRPRWLLPTPRRKEEKGIWFTHANTRQLRALPKTPVTFGWLGPNGEVGWL